MTLLHKVLLGFLGVILITNVVFLNVYIFKVLPAELAREKAISLYAPVQDQGDQEVCGSECQLFIEERISSVVATFSAGKAIKTTFVPTNSPIPKPTPSPTPQAIALESYVPLGTGKTSNDQWEDIPGTEGYIDTASYPSIQKVYFEVNMYIPTKNGRVSARLYNVTDKHPVWNSEVSSEKEVGSLLAAQINLDQGNKLYRVQMKTTLKYESILSFARVKIITSNSN